MQATSDHGGRNIQAGMQGTVRRHQRMLRALRSRDPDVAERVFRACIAESHDRLVARLSESVADKIQNDAT